MYRAVTSGTSIHGGTLILTALSMLQMMFEDCTASKSHFHFLPESLRYKFQSWAG